MLILKILSSQKVSSISNFIGMFLSGIWLLNSFILLYTLDLRENVIAWALQDVDSDGDGRVSLVEFMADYMTKPTDGLEFYGDDHVEQEKDKFKEDFDINGDGYLEGEELSLWLGPDNTEIAIEEAGKFFETVITDNCTKHCKLGP